MPECTFRWRIYTDLYGFSVKKQNPYTAQKIKFSIKDFLSKWDQIHGKLRIWFHLLKKSLMENFIFCAVLYWKIWVAENTYFGIFYAVNCDQLWQN